MTVLYILLFLLFIWIAVSIYQTYVSPKMSPVYNSSNGNGSGSGKQAELMMFYVDWCPHCKTGKPAWDEVKNEYQGRMINGYQVQFKEYNCTEETPEIEELMNQYHIEGYPTIKLIKDGQVVEFDAKPTKSSLEQFLNTVLG
jgi:thiol-disulfide isomerase/thioredoxin